jgi:hypothetical protein
MCYFVDDRRKEVEARKVQGKTKYLLGEETKIPKKGRGTGRKHC